jgi:nitroreductase
MNLLNAFHAQGFGAIWLTGGNAYDPEIARERGFDAEERCLGFVYVGSKPPQDNPLPNRAERSAFVRDWSGAIGVVEARCRLPYRT